MYRAFAGFETKRLLPLCNWLPGRKEVGHARRLLSNCRPLAVGNSAGALLKPLEDRRLPKNNAERLELRTITLSRLSGNDQNKPLSEGPERAKMASRAHFSLAACFLVAIIVLRRTRRMQSAVYPAQLSREKTYLIIVFRKHSFKVYSF